MVLLATGAAWFLWRRSWGRSVAFALGYHALMVLPVLGLLDMIYFAVAPVSNHLQYLALAAPCALAGSGLALLYRRLPSVAVGLGVVASLVLAVQVHGRAEAFESDLTLWERASRDSPSSLYAAMNLAQELGSRVSIAAAVEALQAFADRTSDAADRHLARAHAFVFLRRPGDVPVEALAAEKLRPDVQRQIEIGRFLVTSGFLDDAIRVLSAQAVRSPRSADVRYWLGAALWRTGRPAGGPSRHPRGIACFPGGQQAPERPPPARRPAAGRYSPPGVEAVSVGGALERRRHSRKVGAGTGARNRIELLGLPPVVVGKRDLTGGFDVYRVDYR